MKKHNYLAMICILALGACSDKKETTQTPPSGDDGLTAVILKEAPQSPKAIYDVRKSAKPGETITIAGKVMGRKDPFVEGRAIMILGDPEHITSCDLIPGDSCKTPWDVCCDDPDIIKESTVTVQVVDADGKLLKSGFKGVAGIKELSELIVTGVVAEGSNKDNLLLNASGIYVKP